MKMYFISLMTMFLFFFSAFFAAEAQTIEWSRPAGEDAKLPEGGTPSNENQYNTFELELSISGLQSYRVYDIEVELMEVSEYPGYAANYKSQGGWDMKFDSADYPRSTTPQWVYKGKGKLYWEDLGAGDVPNKIKVRCYDWGGCDC